MKMKPKPLKVWYEENLQEWHRIFAAAFPDWKWCWIVVNRPAGQPPSTFRLEIRRGNRGRIVASSWSTDFNKALAELTEFAGIEDAKVHEEKEKLT